MSRFILSLLAVVTLSSQVAVAQQNDDAAAKAAAEARAAAEAKAKAEADRVSQEATRLEGELGKYKDNAPEAGEALHKLTELYYTNGRVFGLVRAAQRFVAAHPTDQRHAAVMLRLLDGLEALSRHKEFTVIARQFLTRYGNAPQCKDIEERLAYTLEKMNEREDAAEVYRARWKREANANGRKFGVKACTLFAQVGNKGIEQGAELAEEMFDRLPKDEFAKHIGVRSYWEWRRISQWAKATAVGTKLIKSGLVKDAEERREILRTMAENYRSVGQHTNAIEILKQVRAIRDDQWALYYQIQSMYDSAAPAAQMEPLVKEYLNKHKDRDDRYERIGLLALAFNREKNTARALPLFRQLLPVMPGTHSVASYFVSLNGTEPAKLQDTERALLQAIPQCEKNNPQQVWYLRYYLGFTVYRDRLKDIPKAKQVLRDFIDKSPTNDGNFWNVMSWLFSVDENENEFRADVARVMKARRAWPHWTNLRSYPGNWAKNNRRNKDLTARCDYVRAEVQKSDADPVLKLFSSIRRGPYSQKEAEIRQQLAAPNLFNTYNNDVKRYVLYDLGYYYQHYAPGDQRSNAATYWSRLMKLFPENLDYRHRYLQTATDYGQPEVAKEAALAVLAIEPTSNYPDVWRRIAMAGEKNKDADLVRKAIAYARKCNAKFRPNEQYMTSLGDVLVRLELENEATALWTELAKPGRNSYEARESTGKLLQKMEDPKARITFLQPRFQQKDDYHGRYGLWLADAQLRTGDLNGFEQTMKEVLTIARNRPFKSWDVDVWSFHYMLHNYRSSHQDYRVDKEKENTPENALRVARIIRDMDFDWPSSQSSLLLLDAEPADARAPMQRQLEYQRATRRVYADTTRFDQLMPFAQGAITRKDYSAGATLLTGMLNNIPNVDEGRKQRARAMIGQCYARLGSVGLTIDENSPIAPLLQAALYLRLGDDKLALETVLANQALFDQRRDEVPVDLLVFVCENRMAAGGQENHDKVEDILRAWIIKNSESTTIDDNTKARIQFLLAKNFFSSKRYDVARSEYTTVMNRYAETPYAIEAEFGIGETFMAQKVYDQAELVFEKLANSREAEVIVRAEFLRGVLSHRRGDNDEARGIFRSVLERVPNIELANQALFNLAEVYGDEERYMDQLQLLMTVGRLGRVSKRHHAPGRSLSIVVQDSDLGISRGHNRIPVLLRTEPGGDEELVYLTSGGAGKGLFRVDVDTELGPVTKNDKVLQVTGKDLIKCDYPEEFKAEFKSVPLSDVDIQIASDAEFEVASSRIIDEEQETFSERLEREARERERADSRQSVQRPTNQIKPGNPVYLRVKDGDRDLSDATDEIVAKLTADSGDQVQVTLTETEPHSGIFEGTAKTGELPAGALASDTAIDHSPLMAIDKDPSTFWLSEPDGATPKILTVDMKDLRTVNRARFFTPKLDEHRPVRAELEASYDGEFWFRVGSHPAIPEAKRITEAEYGAMRYRFYSGNTTGYTTWQQVLSLANGQPLKEGEVTESQLVWDRPTDDEDAPKYVTMLWYGKFVQPRAGAVRFAVRGTRTALGIDGKLEMPLGPGNRTIDVWLEPGTHDVTIFASAHPNMAQLSAVRARADLNRQQVVLSPFLTTDFDLDQEAAKKKEVVADPTKTDPAFTSIILPLDKVQLQKKTEQFGVVKQENQPDTIGYWQNEEDLAYWNFQAPDGIYDVFLEYSHQGGGSRFQVELNSDQRFESTMPNTGNWQTYRTERVGTVVVEGSGPLKLQIRPLQINSSTMNLRGVQLRPAEGSRVVVSDKAWEFRFDKHDVRYTRLVIHEYLGEAVAINHVEVSGSDHKNPYIPTEADVLALSQNTTLEIAGGDLVKATYTDEVTQANSGGSRLLTGQLQATYFNAAVTPIGYDFVRRNNGQVDNIRKQVKRVEPGERLVVEIVDYDHDQTAAPDQVLFEVSVNDGEPVQFSATETEEYSGVFTKEVDTTEGKEEDKLTVKRGDRIYIRYMDEQNTFPGHSVPRETVVYVNEPTDARIRILETRVIPPPPESEAPPRVTYHEPAEDAELSNVAFEAPLTIEVIDPDAARDSRSEITVRVQTTDGAKADVRCVVSGALSQVPGNTAEDWALEEGRFVGQVILQLGSSTSPEIVPITPDMPRNLIGGGRLAEDEEEAAALDSSLVARVLNLTGKDRIGALYQDEFRADGNSKDLPSFARLISNGTLACTDRDYDKEVKQLHVGEKLFLMVTDADQDSSDERDSTTVQITTEFGEEELVTLVETLAHSGVFTGSFTLRSNEKPTPGNLDADDPEI